MAGESHSNHVYLYLFPLNPLLQLCCRLNLCPPALDRNCRSGLSCSVPPTRLSCTLPHLHRLQPMAPHTHVAPLLITIIIPSDHPKLMTPLPLLQQNQPTLLPSPSSKSWLAPNQLKSTNCAITAGFPEYGSSSAPSIDHIHHQVGRDQQSRMACESS